LGDGFDGIFGGDVFFHGEDYSIDWLFFWFCSLGFGRVFGISQSQTLWIASCLAMTKNQIHLNI
jgi:hypothetical protein